MPNDLIQALMQSGEQPQPGPSPFGMEPPRAEDAIRNLYKAKAPQSSWLAPPPEPVPQGQGFWQGFAQDALKYAPLGLRAGGLGVVHRSPTTGRFIANPAKGNAPIAAGAATGGPAASLIDWNKYSPEATAGKGIAGVEGPTAPALNQAGLLDTMPPIDMTSPRVGGMSVVPKDNAMPMDATSFGDRFGGMSPPSQPPAPEMPQWMQGAGVAALPGAGMNVPLPRPKPPPVPLPRPKPRMPPQPVPQAAPQDTNPIAQFLRSLGLG